MRPRYLLISLIVSGCAWTQTRDVVLAPKPLELTRYTPPHKPLTKIQDVRAKHEGAGSWEEPVVDDDYFTARYVARPAGAKEARRLHPDTRIWWIVLDGQLRFDIEGQQPFVASKGYIVQVPMQTFYSIETVGERPSLRFEVMPAKGKTLYPRDAQPPELPGFRWMPVRFARKPGVYGEGNRPFATFEELAQNVERRRAPMTQTVVRDDRGVANFIYGYEKNLPPLNPKDRGHYHPECAEFWLIMAGQIRYPIEGQGVIIASEGDVVYVPKFTYHAPRFYGPGPSCRLAMNGYPNIAHLFDADVGQ
ncbi:MAG TPA: cupin domain-containing protein [Bryobacteraceae bacterium]|jgi:mannose-6-phosphate isomerase-like protein (cupin superfamily)|nr:cupin domain-containing protein [Bryobacteraceae bacterium]